MTTYATEEVSTQDAAPFELYKFTGNGTGWHFTTTEYTVTYLGQDYVPTIVSREAIIASGENQSNTVVITVPRDHALIEQFIAASAPTPIALTIFRNQRGNTLTETVVIFIGQVSNIEVDGGLAKLTCTSLESEFTNPLGRIHVQLTCPWMLYDTQCTADPAGFTHTGTLSAISGPSITVVGTPTIDPDTTFYVNGFAVAAGQRRFITSQSGTAGTYTLGLMVAFTTPPINGDPIVLVAGCDRTVHICKARFNNVPRFGGFPFMPNRSPWVRLF